MKPSYLTLGTVPFQMNVNKARAEVEKERLITRMFLDRVRYLPLQERERTQY